MRNAIALLVLTSALLSGCWWWPPWPPGGGSGGSGGTSAGGSSGSGGTGGSVVCQDGDAFEITCTELAPADCGAMEPFVIALPMPPDDYCDPPEFPVNACVLEVDRVCGPPEQYAAQTITAELWEGGNGSMTLTIVDTLNHGVDCTSDYTCTTRQL
jgi:hypothetical protein